MNKKPSIKFKRAAVVGVGLIGSSLARALRERDVAETVIGVDQDEDILARAKKIGVIDHGFSSLDEGVKGADLIILSTPVGALTEICRKVSDCAEDGALIIDVGSVKGVVLDAAKALPDRIFFVPCHPVAGTEQSGPEAGFASLFEKRWCIITPLERNDAPYLEAVKQATGLWTAIGAEVEVMDAAHHDLALAVTSHIPHLIAFTMIGAADDIESVAQGEVVKYSAGGFRDFTRIAASDPVMWRDVFLNNREAVLEVLGRFSEELAVMQRAIRWGDADALYNAFSRGRSLRRAIVDAGQETAAPNFGRDEPHVSGEES
ncbi:prephenate/arogenate dehydrogenase family protein [Hyphococcus sp. DH-69]|uniref:prephenate/arogenate dehydrogenase family protein n=1 Tax=Hyphococcus formosus TaxID=3143534 RepID=UPI00398AE0C0